MTFLELLRAQEWRWNWFAVMPFVGAVACYAMAGLIWMRRPRELHARATFAPVALVVATWNLGVAVSVCMANDVLAMPLSRFIYNCIVLSGPAAVHFTSDFARVRNRGRLMASVWVGAAIVSAFVWLDPEVFKSTREAPWGGFYPLGGTHFVPSAALVLVTIMIAAGMCQGVRRRTPPSRRRRQASYIMLSYGAAALAAVDMLGVRGYPVPPLGWAASLLSIVIIYYAMVRWRLMDVRTALHRTLTWATVLATTFLPLWLIARASSGWSGWRTGWARALAVVMILIVLRVYAAWILPAVSELIARRRRRSAEIAERFAARALEARRPDDLIAPLGEALSATGGLALVAVLLRVDSGEFLPIVSVLPAGAPPPPPDTLERALRPNDLPIEPVMHAELDPEDPAQANRIVTALLAAYQCDALLPMRHAGQVVGAILARDPRAHGAAAGPSQRTLDEDTREALQGLAARAAVLLTNAALHQALDRSSAGLEVAVKDRTRALQGAIEDLKGAQASLVQAERQSSLGLLVAGVSHEINNALNFIYGNLPMLEKYARTYDELAARCLAAGAQPGPEVLAAVEQARGALPPALDAVGEAARRARSIVEDLRRFARHDEAERKLADVREGLESTVSLLAAELRGRIEVERRYGDDLPAIDCYPAALNHVFLNVLLNASQAIGDRGTIVVELARAADGGIDVAIADDGAGVAPDAEARIFEPFFTTRRRAAGLGLTVSRQIVERHGGTIDVGPNPAGKGSRVAIHLPSRVAAPV